MNAFLARVFDLLYPRICANCGRVGESWCTACLDELAAYSFEAKMRELDSGLRVVTIGKHAGLLRRAIHAFKFEDARYLAETLGGALADGMIKTQIQVDIVVPVPLHAQREVWRGYNQSALLASVVAENLNVPMAHALERVRGTGTQVGRDAEARKVAVHGAFLGDNSQVASQRVLLIDDVVTTGSTLLACAEALYSAGAASVTAACVTSP